MQQITNENIKEILSFINPAVLSYQEWVNIGMALKDEGIDCSVWDEWSQNGTRYHAGECERKWKTFNGSSSPVTIATVMQMAFENGYRSGTDSYELDWDSEIGGAKDDFVIVDKNWIESKEIKEPAVWNPAAEIILIISNDIGNKHSPTVIIAAITNRVHTKAKLLTYTPVSNYEGFDKDSVILLEQIRTIDKQRLKQYHILLNKEHFNDLGSDCFNTIYAEKIKKRNIKSLEKLGFSVSLS